MAPDIVPCASLRLGSGALDMHGPKASVELSDALQVASAAGFEKSTAGSSIAAQRRQWNIGLVKPAEKLGATALRPTPET